jgi:hypothetical protein
MDPDFGGNPCYTNPGDSHQVDFPGSGSNYILDRWMNLRENPQDTGFLQFLTAFLGRSYFNDCRLLNKTWAGN